MQHLFVEGTRIQLTVLFHSVCAVPQIEFIPSRPRAPPRKGVLYLGYPNPQKKRLFETQNTTTAAPQGIPKKGKAHRAAFAFEGR